MALTAPLLDPPLRQSHSAHLTIRNLALHAMPAPELVPARWTWANYSYAGRRVRAYIGAQRLGEREEEVRVEKRGSLSRAGIGIGRTCLHEAHRGPERLNAEVASPVSTRHPMASTPLVMFGSVAQRCCDKRGRRSHPCIQYSDDVKIIADRRPSPRGRSSVPDSVALVEAYERPSKRSAQSAATSAQ